MISKKSIIHKYVPQLLTLSVAKADKKDIEKIKSEKIAFKIVLDEDFRTGYLNKFWMKEKFWLNKLGVTEDEIIYIYGTLHHGLIVDEELALSVIYRIENINKDIFLLAAYWGLFDIVKNYISFHDNIELNLINQALLEASTNGHASNACSNDLEIVKFLIRVENINTSELRFLNISKALFLASLNGHLETVKFLLENDDISKNKNISETDIIIRAAENGQLEVVKLLLKQFFPLNLKKYTYFGTDYLNSIKEKYKINPIVKKEILELLIEQNDRFEYEYYYLF